MNVWFLCIGSMHKDRSNAWRSMLKVGPRYDPRNFEKFWLLFGLLILEIWFWCTLLLCLLAQRPCQRAREAQNRLSRDLVDLTKVEECEPMGANPHVFAWSWVVRTKCHGIGLKTSNRGVFWSVRSVLFGSHAVLRRFADHLKHVTCTSFLLLYV